MFEGEVGDKRLERQPAQTSLPVPHISHGTQRLLAVGAPYQHVAKKLLSLTNFFMFIYRGPQHDHRHHELFRMLDSGLSIFNFTKLSLTCRILANHQKKNE